MKQNKWVFFVCGIYSLTLFCVSSAFSQNDLPKGKIAEKPLFRDPIYDGAADPSLCWNRSEGKWFMFYTNRRANMENPQGVSWVHGTHIGIAESSDFGATWQYRGIADIDYGKGEKSHWAPEVIEHEGTYHMYLTFVPGIFEDWNASRDIIHLISHDLLEWNYESTLQLSSDRVIDACVFQLPNGTWRMWYNNEVDRKSIYYADSPDLYEWTDHGKAIGDQPGEGPKVFSWKGAYWMVVDIWNGLGVYRSEDCQTWTRQPENLLETPGEGTDDQVKGGHPDVVVSGDRAFLFYFTHPGRQGSNADDNAYEQRRSSIQVVELHHDNGTLTCDRDEPTHVFLAPKEIQITNPLIQQRADPWIYRHTDGYYYFTATVPEYDRLILRRAPTIQHLASATETVIWSKHETGIMGSHIWAPELHYIEGKWYIYFAAGGAEDVWAIRMYVLENDSANPLEGTWKERGQIETQWDSFSLDATTFEHHGKRYLVWAQHAPEIEGNTNLYIAKMANPWTLRGNQVMISQPEYDWETIGYRVNEGAAVIKRNGRIFLSYSASATDSNYAMGLLTAPEDSDLVDANSWSKSPTPVFHSANGVYGPGHNSFTVSLDGTTDLLVYHGRDYKEISGDPLRDPNRHTRVQPFQWNQDGTPTFGSPVANGTIQIEN